MATRDAVSADPEVREGVSVVMTVNGLESLIMRLHDQGFDVQGPTVRNGAIIVGPVRHVADLPVGWRDEHSPGRYELVDAHDQSVFQWSVGPSSFKATFFPPSQDVWRASRGAGSVEIIGPNPLDQDRGVAMVGARPCDAAALGVLDGVLRDGAIADPS